MFRVDKMFHRLSNSEYNSVWVLTLCRELGLDIISPNCKDYDDVSRVNNPCLCV